MAPKRKVVLGTDFSGLCAPSIALDQLGVGHTYAFACDVQRSCRKILAHWHKPDVIYEDIQKRDMATTPACDLYVSGFPCQAFSDLGLRQGSDDTRGRGLLVCNSLDYINTKMPKAIIMENVAAILQPRHKALHDLVTTSLSSMGYILGEAVLNTADFGLPQQRNRWFLLAIHRDSIRSPADDLSHIFPTPRSYCIRLEQIITPLPARSFKMLPPGTTGKAKLWRANVKKAYAQIAKTGVNPFTKPCVVDIKSSPSYSSYKVGRTPTLTRTRCSGMGYWCSTKGGVMTCKEMALLQGIPETYDWTGAGISSQQYGAMIGNSMSVNVLTCLLPDFLYAAQLVSLATRNTMKSHAF